MWLSDRIFGNNNHVIQLLMENDKKRSPMRETTTQRHMEVFSYYEELVMEYGQIARGLSKEFLFQQVADKFHYSTDLVGKIIRKQLKGK